MRTIAIINQKGGCGKTTTAINLAGVLARQGRRTLLVDLDPQSHCAAGLAIPEQRIDVQIGDAMLARPEQAIDWTRLLWRVSRHLDLAPSTVRLAAIESLRGGLAGVEHSEHRLQGVLRRLADQYEFCVIDCPPNIGLLTFNALAAAGEIIIPVETAFFSLQGAGKQLATVRAVAKRLGVAPAVRVLATMHDRHNPLASDVLEELTRRFGDALVPVVVRVDARLKEAASFGQPIVDYAGDSLGAQDYVALTSWLLSDAARVSGRETLREGTPSAIPSARPGAHPVPRPVVVDLPGARLEPPHVQTLAHAHAATRTLISQPASSQPVSPERNSTFVTALLGEVNGTHAGPVAMAGLGAGNAGVQANGLAKPTLLPAPGSPVLHVDISPAMAAGLAAGMSAGLGASASPSRVTISSPAGIPGDAASGRAASAMESPTATALMNAPARGSLGAGGWGGLNGPTAASVAGLTVEDDAETLQTRLADLTDRVGRLAARALTLPKVDLEDESAREPLPVPRSLLGSRVTASGVLFVQPLNGASSICVAGDFNGWSPSATPLKASKRLGVFELTLPLPAGRHRYRLIVDGRWTHDEHNPHSEPNPFGELNSVIDVPNASGSGGAV